MKKKIILLGSFMLILLAGLVYTTAAWLTDQKSQTTTYVMGDVNYEITSNIQDSVVVPGQPLLNEESIVITNKSTVKSHLRLQISVTSDNQSCDDLLKIVAGTNWVSGDDGYYYYKGKDLENSNDDIPARSSDAGDVIALDLAASFDGAKVGNSHSNKTYSVTVTIQGKQADYVTWQDMALVDFSTGLAS